MLDRHTDKHNDDEAEIFAIEMEPFGDGSRDPALWDVFERLWRARAPSSNQEAFSCCAQFLLDELVELRSWGSPEVKFDLEAGRTAAKSGGEFWQLWIETEE